MSLVKAEVGAIRELRKSITDYVGHVRAALDGARRELIAVQSKTRNTVDDRRRAAERAVRELQQAREAVARAPKERRADLQERAATAERRAAERQQSLDQARRAARTVDAAAGELVRAMQRADTAVTGDSSAAVSILATLDSKLSEITGGSAGFLRSAVISLGVAAETAIAVADVGTLAGNVSQGRIPTADDATTISEMVDQKTERDQQLYKDAEDLRREKRDASGRDGPGTSA